MGRCSPPPPLVISALSINTFNSPLGKGTSHRVNSIILQPGSFGYVRNEPTVATAAPPRKKCRRSLNDIPVNILPSYSTGKRCGPEPMAITENDEREFLLADQDKINLAWILSRRFSVPQIIPSWAGFQISIRNNLAVVKTSVGYLDSIDAPATEISTVYHVLQRCLKIKDSLNIQCIICVFDQAIYCKAMEIKWKHPDQFKDCIIMLGIFHTIMMYLGIFGKTLWRCWAARYFSSK